MTISKDRRDYCSQGSQRLYLFVYEVERNCAQNIPWNREKSEEFYILLGSFVLMISLCVLCYDLILLEPTEGVEVGSVIGVTQAEGRRHNTLATAPRRSSTPLLAPTQYWM